MPLFRKRSSEKKRSQQDAVSATSSTSMPLFRKQGQSAKTRLQHQQYLAKESPEKMFDISSCELSDIPSGTYSLCKVLQKEALIAHSNWLSSLKGGGDMRDLGALRVLDLHSNELSGLPDEIGQLKSLQVLILDGNRIKHLPASIYQLPALQTLSIKGNKLKDMPEGMQELRSLRSLDVSHNHLTRLPRDMCYVRTLDTLILEASDKLRMDFPSAEICMGGTEAIMKFLCSESGVEYEPPSKFVLDVLDGHTLQPGHDIRRVSADMDAITEKVQQYELAKANRHQEVRYLEKQIQEENKLQAKLAVEAAIHKKHLVDFVAQDQERFNDELAALQFLKEQDRKKLVKSLYDAEQNASYIIDQLLELGEKAKKSEELLEQMERERMENEEWFKVRQEEVTNLRKREVLTAMHQTLAANEDMDQVILNHLRTNDEVTRQTQLAAIETDGKLQSVLTEHSVGQQHLVEYLLNEEKLQKDAFEMLQFQKDSKHLRIMTQIGMIHQQLATLTAVERDQRGQREETQQDVLEQRRRDLMDILLQLMKERELRETELKKRMLEMEEQREANQTDYWLVQYQRLMDRKPHTLIDREKQLEFAVVEILEAAQATDYLPVFARHRITIETLCSLSEDDLKQMGMYEVGLRKAILREVEHYKLREEEQAAAKLKKLHEPVEGKWLVRPPCSDMMETPEPSAPKKSPLTPSSPPLDIVARGIDSECVICMDLQSEVLFLNCGHVCCCQKCAEPLEECPMCRGEIIQRILMA